jgi:predicted nicotinamide N-methyase
MYDVQWTHDDGHSGPCGCCSMDPNQSGSRLAERNSNGRAVIVQDVLLGRLRGCSDGSEVAQRGVTRDGGDDDNDASDALFELANAPEIGYHVVCNVKRKDSTEECEEEGGIIYIHQDVSACGRHTGGIVWETCFLLLEYLSLRVGVGGTDYGADSSSGLGRALEVGAGCGLLGQVLAARGLCRSILLTEAPDVLPNLRANVDRNAALIHKVNGGKATLECCGLDWVESEEGQRRQHPTLHSGSTFDTILGTDVLFAPHLVVPLLDTLRRYSHSRTQIYLCVQVRCPTSHQMFLERSPSRGFALKDLTSELQDHPSCAWGVELECHLFLLMPSDT